MLEKKEGPMQDMIDRGNLSLQVTKHDRTFAG